MTRIPTHIYNEMKEGRILKDILDNPISPSDTLIINPDGYYETACGILAPKSMKSTKPPKAFDFFAGCGGFSLGFIKAGWQVVGMNELAFDAMLTYTVNLSKQPLQVHFDTEERSIEMEEYLQKQIFKDKNKSYFKHGNLDYLVEDGELYYPPLPGTGWILSEELNGTKHPPVEHIFVADVRNLNGEEMLAKMNMKIGELDCVMGGPPCQGYSKSGKQQIDDPRNELIFHFARLIVELNPKTFVMEEVPDIVNFRTPRGTYVLEEFGQILDEGGFMEFSQFCEAMKFMPKSKRFRKIKPRKSMKKIESGLSPATKGALDHKKKPLKQLALEL